MWIIRPKNAAQPLGVTGPGEGLVLRRSSEGKGAMVSKTRNISNPPSEKASEHFEKKVCVTSNPP